MNKQPSKNDIARGLDNQSLFLPEQNRMKIASYNIYEGAWESLPELEEFVRQEDPDVLCLQEANGWLKGPDNQLDRFAKATGLTHTAAGSNSRFTIATLSRLPFVNAQVHQEGFHHGAIQTTIDTPGGTIDLWNTHLYPFNEDGRIREAEYMAHRIPMDGQALIVGDLNSLSRTDNYADDFARRYHAKTKGGSKEKFGTTHNRYEVTDTLEHSGFIDLAARLGAPTNTVPTPVNKDEAHADELRLDYMFATRKLAERALGITVPKTALTGRISDHYPQVLTLSD